MGAAGRHREPVGAGSTLASASVARLRPTEHAARGIYVVRDHRVLQGKPALRRDQGFSGRQPFRLDDRRAGGPAFARGQSVKELIALCEGEEAPLRSQARQRASHEHRRFNLAAASKPRTWDLRASRK